VVKKQPHLKLVLNMGTKQPLFTSFLHPSRSYFNFWFPYTLC